MSPPARQADLAELDSWMAAWYAPAFRTACLVLDNRADAEEAVQEAFLRLWRFRDSMPSGEGARPWLFRVLMNACYSHAGKEQRVNNRRSESEADLPGDERRTPEALVVAHDRTRIVLEALARLPEQLRVPVVLRYYAGLSEREIALAIHRRPGTVKSRLHEARQRLSADPALGTLGEKEGSR